MQSHFRGWEQKLRAQAEELECFWRACRHNTSKHLKDKTTISSAYKASCQIQKKMSVRPNLSICVHAEKSQKISTNVTIHSGLMYGPQRPRTWLSGLFLCKLWHLRLTSRAFYMFWLNICTQLCWWKELKVHTNLTEFILPSVCV